MQMHAPAIAAFALLCVPLAGCAPTLPGANAALIAGSIEKNPQLLPGVPDAGWKQL